MKKDIGYEFKKSLYCEECDCGCVEVKQGKDKIFVRSTFRQEDVVEFTFDEWEVFVKGVKSGEFDIQK
jgi:hypothetical protein